MAAGFSMFLEAISFEKGTSIQPRQGKGDREQIQIKPQEMASAYHLSGLFPMFKFSDEETQVRKNE